MKHRAPDAGKPSTAPYSINVRDSNVRDLEKTVASTRLGEKLRGDEIIKTTAFLK